MNTTFVAYYSTVDISLTVQYAIKCAAEFEIDYKKRLKADSKIVFIIAYVYINICLQWIILLQTRFSVGVGARETSDSLRLIVVLAI